MKILKLILKRILQIILRTILSLIIIIAILLLIINNKKISIYENSWETISILDDKIMFYPKIKKINKEDLEWYRYEWYMILSLNKLEIEILNQNSYEKYKSTNWETMNYTRKARAKLDPQAYKYTKERNDNLNFLDKIGIAFNLKSEIYYYQNWQTWIINNWYINNSYEKILDWKQIKYYENWQILEESNYIKGELDWKQISYYENWNIKEEAKYKNDIHDWDAYAYYPEWEILATWNFIKWNWTLYFYKKDWELIGKSERIDSRINSWIILLYDEWNTTKIINFNNWIKDWYFTGYRNDENNNISFDIISEKWHYLSWKLDWEYNTYYKSWTIREECIFNNWTGTCKEYKENGELDEEYNY